MKAFLLALAVAVGNMVGSSQSAATAGVPAANAQPAYVPQRVFDTRRRAFIDFEAMLLDLARADVVLVGEQHDNPNTHRLETALLQGLLRRSVAVIVSLEMFERDVQTSLDAYLAGTLSEEDFLKVSRPWPRYGTDYRSLVELAKAHRWPVIAANVPRRYASDVAKSGRTTLDALPLTERSLVAQELRCPEDEYFRRFAEQMSSHPAGEADAAGTKDRKATERAATERFYWSQCLKDETMAESIAAGFERQGDRRAAVVHFTGSFHSDFGAGTAERVRRRLSGRRVAVVSMLPVADLDTLSPGKADRKRAEFLVYTLK